MSKPNSRRRLSPLSWVHARALTACLTYRLSFFARQREGRERASGSVRPFVVPGNQVGFRSVPLPPRLLLLASRTRRSPSLPLCSPSSLQRSRRSSDNFDLLNSIYQLGKLLFEERGGRRLLPPLCMYFFHFCVRAAWRAFGNPFSNLGDEEIE